MGFPPVCVRGVGAEIEPRQQIQPGFLKAAVLQQCLPQFSGTYKDGPGFRDEIQVILNIPDQLLPGAPRSAPACVRNLRQVLAHLYFPQSQGLGDGCGGDLLLLRGQCFQIFQINRQPGQCSFGYFIGFHSFPPSMFCKLPAITFAEPGSRQFRGFCEICLTDERIIILFVCKTNIFVIFYI